MKTMKTSVPLKQNLLKSVFFVFISTAVVVSHAQSSTGLQSDNSSVQPVAVGKANNSLFNPLANKLASFTVSLNYNKVDLKWATDIEINLSHIMVEKSMDGKNFKDAALVFTYGNTTARSEYFFADNISTIKSGIVYYRLRSVDTDGTAIYSETRIIEITKETETGKTALAYKNR
jgi:hypothetical protein